MLIKPIAALTALCLLLSACGAPAASGSVPATSSASSAASSPAAEPAAKLDFTDSLGRQVQLDSTLTQIAPCGSVAQMILYTLAPELLVGWASNPSDNTKPYIPEQYWTLPEFGQFYGKNVSLNLEALLAAGPQVIIDMGDIKPNMATDLDGISTQLALPVAFIEANLQTMPQAYRTLGKLLGREQKAEQLALYCEKTLVMAERVRGGVTPDKVVTAYYGTGPDSLGCNPNGSIHATVLDLVGVQNAAVVENVSPKGGGNPIDMEQLMQFDPDLLLLGAGGVYQTAATDPVWQQLRAVQQGRIYQIPNRPYDFLSSPPSMNRIIGLHWLAALAYPELYDLDLAEELREFYQLFYGYTLGDTELQELLQSAKSR